MPTFTHTQLNQGVVTTSLGGAITAQFQNPSGSAYFFLVQNTSRDEDSGFIPEQATSYATGTFSNLNRISDSGIVQERFKLGVVVPEGSSSMDFTPTDTSGGGSITLKGTGMFKLII